MVVVPEMESTKEINPPVEQMAEGILVVRRAELPDLVIQVPLLLAGETCWR